MDEMNDKEFKGYVRAKLETISDEVVKINLTIKETCDSVFLNEIIIDSGYSLDIQNVQNLAVPSEKLQADARQASTLVYFSREAKNKEGEFTDDLMFYAISEFVIKATMDNAAMGDFLNFTEDIEAVLAKDESRGGLCGDYYIVRETWVSEIDMTVTEEFNIEQTQEAYITVNVGYSYIPLKLSGSSDRLG